MIFRLTILIVLVALGHSRNVVVDVKAPWPKISSLYLAELAEFLAEQAPEAFWNYVENLCQESSKIDSLLSQKSHDANAELQALAFDAASSLTPKSMHAYMDTMLGLGSFSPTMQFFQTISSRYGNPCNGNAYVVLYPRGEISCQLPDLTLHAQCDTVDDSLFGVWDHLFPVDDTEASFRKPDSAVVLYGIVGSSSYCLLHNELKLNSKKNLVRYYTRPAAPGSESISNETYIQGFGVFLDIKNMEYKNVDDKEVKGIEEETSDKASSD